jgi:hypothetical protein
MKSKRAWPVWAIGLVSQFNGCFAPSYMTPKKPYSKSSGSIIGKTDYYAYDSTVAMQVIPWPLCAVFGWQEDSQGRDITLSSAMPMAFVGMIVFGSIVLPFVGVFRKG